MKNKKLYESPEVEVLEISLSDLLSDSPADEEEHNGKIELPWDNL